jgi:hypothetical protein
VAASLAAAACVSGGSGIEVPRVCGGMNVSTVVDRLPA